MKPLLLLIVLLIIVVLPSTAKVLTVSNNPNVPGQYQAIQPAVDAASAGDTIFIQGSPNGYAGFNLNKMLIIIGPGHNPKKQNAFIANVAAITFSQVNVDYKGTTFIGLTIDKIITGCVVAQNVLIKRCRINAIELGFYCTPAGVSQDWVIESNIINSIDRNLNQPEYVNRFIIRNNIITQGIIRLNNNIIQNNIFLSTLESNSSRLRVVKSSTVSNNIFYGTPDFPQVENCVFQNNIFYFGKNFTFPFGSNTGSGNLVEVDPQFTNFPAQGGTFNYSYNFRLKDNSPGKNAGTDGKDIGLYGGVGFSETGEPPIPQILQFTIKNSVVAPDGKLNISTKAQGRN